MFKLILLSILVIVVVGPSQARPQVERDANILGSESENHNGDGNFFYSFDTSNNIGVIAAGRIKNPEAKSDDQIQEIVGCYSYIDTNGQPVVVTYTADERGYRPIITNLEVCPDLNVLRGGGGGGGGGGGVRTTTPKPEEFYRVIDEQGNVVAVLPRNTNLVG